MVLPTDVSSSFIYSFCIPFALSVTTNKLCYSVSFKDNSRAEW